MNRHINENKSRILHNSKIIDDNKRSIEELKHYTFSAFESAIKRYERIVHLLIMVVILSLTLLFVSNAVWLYSWNRHNATVVNTDGTTNFIGNDGSIDNKGE